MRWPMPTWLWIALVALAGLALFVVVVVKLFWWITGLMND